jgi:hypothetical protein
MEVYEIGQKSFLKFKNLKQHGVFHFTTPIRVVKRMARRALQAMTKRVTMFTREELAGALGIDPQQLILSRQCMGHRIAIRRTSMTLISLELTH